MSTTNGAVRLAGTLLKQHRHICAFFNTREEEYRVLLPFIKEGLDCGDKAFHIVDPQLRDDHVRRLNQASIDVSAALERGQLDIREWREAYLRGDVFDQYAMLDLIEQVLQSGRSQGYPLTRLVAHMEWSLEDRAGVEDIVEYESRLNDVLSQYADPVICTYDCTRFGAGVALDILRTHPLVIIGGILQENPFYVPPSEFLDELRLRNLAPAN